LTVTATTSASIPTATPKPQPDTLLPAPTLQGPEDGFVFEGSDAQITLEWTPVKPSLADDEFYLIAIDFKPKPELSEQEGEVVWTDYVWRKQTNWSANECKYLLDNSVDGVFSWSVKLILSQAVDDNGVPQGPALSEASEERNFVWRETKPGGGPGPKPTVSK
jgi:hypothetical protein